MFIKIKNLTKTYQSHEGKINAVDHLSIDINKGAFVTITGASGSGKTTLLLILGGLLKPTSGELIYNDKSINLQNDNDLATFRSNHIGFVMQSFALVPYLTAVENVMIALNVKSRNNALNREKAIELLDWVGLGDRTTHYPKELSAGQQQRVAIARALANNPDLLLADEPTGNLDPNLSDEIMSILETINKTHHTTIIMVTHSPKAAEVGNVKVQLKNGKIISVSDSTTVENVLEEEKAMSVSN